MAKLRVVAEIEPQGNFPVVSAPNVAVGNTTLDAALTGIGTDISGKVDKVTGKGLSTEDYTTAEKNKLAGIDVFNASGSNHSSGLVPDPGATAGTSKFLCENGTWAEPSGGGGGSGTVTGVKVGTTSYSPDSSGVVSIPAYPDVSGKIDTAGTGLSKSGTTLNHSNSVTAKTTAGAYKIKFDSSGHITGTASLSYSDVGAASSGHTHSGYVSTSRTVNGYSLSSNISLDYEDVGLKVSTQTLTLSSMSFTKSFGGMYYASSISPNTSYSQIFSVTMNSFNNLPNMAFMPYVVSTNKIGLMVCAPAAPSSLSFSAGTIGITIVGI